MKILFFDLGSTLIDETACEKKRIIETIQNTTITYGEFNNKMLFYAAQNQNAYKCVLRDYGLKKVEWDTTLERLYPCVQDVLRVLCLKYRLGIIANQNVGLHERLKTFGILNYFEIVVSSSDVGTAKPDAEIFKTALKQAKVLPSDTIMIGDRLDNDIIPAQNLGMKTIWIRQGYGSYGNVQLLSRKPDYILENLMQLSQIL